MGGSSKATSGEEAGDADARNRQTRMARDDGSSIDSRPDNKKQRRDNSKEGGQCFCFCSTVMQLACCRREDRT